MTSNSERADSDRLNHETNSVSGSSASTVGGIAELLYNNDVPTGETVSSQIQAVSIISRVLTECREGLREEHPRAVEITKQLQDCLTEVIVTLRAAKCIKRALSSFDP